MKFDYVFARAFDTWAAAASNEQIDCALDHVEHAIRTMIADEGEQNAALQIAHRLLDDAKKRGEIAEPQPMHASG